ncbi:MAG: hypothetical protein IPK13_28025 [Deltaproteobacteria bacterium]|nr:hypothetical protein [Deltaproteobacteria bacterium]
MESRSLAQSPLEALYLRVLGNRFLILTRVAAAALMFLHVACSDDCEFPATQGLSAPCCMSRGIDACGAGLVCAALDGRSQASCYLEHSRNDHAECTDDIQCMSGSCNKDFGSCRSSPTALCTLSLGCGGGPTHEPHHCAPSPACVEEPCELRCLPCGLTQSAACRSGSFSTSSDGGVPTSHTSAPADILFVVDNSSSTDVLQDRVAAAITAFIDEAPENADYHMAVISTDVDSSGGERGGTVTNVFAHEFPYQWTSSNSASACYRIGIEHGCFRGDVPARRIVSSRLPVEDRTLAMTTNVLVGSCGSGSERGFDSAALAFEQMGRGGCNEGFLRNDATLTLVFISDEDDRSDRSVLGFVSHLDGLKPIGRAMVRVAALVSAVDGEAMDCRVGRSGEPSAECGSLCEEECPRCAPVIFSTSCQSCTQYATPDCCHGLAGTRYQELALTVGRMASEQEPTIPFKSCSGPPGEPAACLVESVCTEEFSPIMRRIARDLVFW